MIFDAPIQNKRFKTLFTIFDLRPSDALRYRRVDSRPRKPCAAKGARGLIVDEWLDGVASGCRPRGKVIGLVAPEETISSALLARYNER
jgi:hypothetical protein